MMVTILDSKHEQELRAIAAGKVRKLRKFYTHLVIYLIAVMVYVLNLSFNVSLHFFPFKAINWFGMSVWTSAIIIHAAVIFTTTIVVGKKWEERQIKRMLEKKTKKQIWK